MTIYAHRRPVNPLNQSLDPGNVVQANELAVHPARRVLFTQSQQIVGGLPLTRDGFGGLNGLQRDVYETTTTLTVATLHSSISLSGSTLSAGFAFFDFVWQGIYHRVIGFAADLTLTAGQLTSSTWYLVVQRNYGFSLSFSTTIPESVLTMTIAKIVVSNSVVTPTLWVQTSFGTGLYVHEANTPSLLIPCSDSSGNMTA